MTRAAATEAAYEVDDEGFVELGGLERDWLFLAEMRRQAEALAVGIKRAEAMFQEKMVAVNATGFKINGVRKVIYKQNATFPAAKYAEKNPGVADAFTKMVPKFDTAAFKAARPEEYRQWQGFTYKYVTPTAGN